MDDNVPAWVKQLQSQRPSCSKFTLDEIMNQLDPGFFFEPDVKFIFPERTDFWTTPAGWTPPPLNRRRNPLDRFDGES